MSVLRAFLLLLALALAGVVAYIATPATDVPVQLQEARMLDAPRLLEDFELVDQHGESFQRQDLEENWSLVFIGFTHCPDVCPATLHLLDELDQRLRSDGYVVNPVFISVDPERDTPEVLARYVGHFSERIVGATGPHDQLARLCDGLDFAYVRIPASKGRYTIDHSGALALINPQSHLVGYFMPPFDSNRLTTDLAIVLEQGRSE